MERTRDIGPFRYDEANILEDILMRWAFPMISYYRRNSPELHNTIEIPKRIHYPEHLEAIKKAWDIEKKKKIQIFTTPLKQYLERSSGPYCSPAF